MCPSLPACYSYSITFSSPILSFVLDLIQPQMHQYKIVAQILLILSIFNLVFAIPVEREFDDAHNVVTPKVVRKVAATSKERREVSDGTPSHSSPPLPDAAGPSLPPPDGSTLTPPTPDGSIPSHSSSPLPDGLPSDRPASSNEIQPASPPPGGPAPSHELPAPPPDGPAPLHELPAPPQDGPAPLHELPPPPPGGPAALPVVPAPDQPAPGRPTSSSRHSVVYDESHLPSQPLGAPRLSDWNWKKVGGLAGAVSADAVLLAAILGGGVLWHNHHKHQSRMIDPDRYVSSPSHRSRRRLNVPNHNHLTYEIFLSPTAKGSRDLGFERDD